MNIFKQAAQVVIEHQQLQAKARGIGVDAEELNIALASTIELMAAGLSVEDLRTLAKTAASGRFRPGKHAK